MPRHVCDVVFDICCMLLLFNHQVGYNSCWPHGLQHTRLPCPSPSPEVCSNSCPWSWWCHPTVSSSAALFSFCRQSFPASESFPTSQLFAWGGQNIGVSASTSVLPVSVQRWFPLGLTGLIFLPSKGLSRVFCCTILKHQLGAFFDAHQFSLVLSLLYGPTPLNGRNKMFYAVCGVCASGESFKEERKR